MANEVLRGVRAFSVALLFSLASLTVATLVGYRLTGVGAPSTANGAELQSWLATASLILGVSATLAAAWATVRLGDAALIASESSLSIANSQRNRDDDAFVEERLERMLSTFSQLCCAVGD